MKNHRFYSKSYEHPAIRYSKKWGIEERFLHNIYNYVFGDGWKPSQAIQYLKDVSGKIITRHQFGWFLSACNRYKDITTISLKPAQYVSNEFSNRANRRTSFRTLNDIT